MATKKNLPRLKRAVPPLRNKTLADQPVFTLPFFQPGFWKEHRFPIIILFALAFFLYGSTLGFGYLQDDQLVIWDNIFVQKGFGGLMDIFGNDSMLGYYREKKNLLEGGRYRPFPLMTYALEVVVLSRVLMAAELG